MPGFASRDDLILEITTNAKQDPWFFYKIAPSVSQSVATWQSLWKGVGNPGAGADPATTPGTVYATDAGSSTAGAIWFPDRSADLRYLLSLGAVANQACTLLLYDRLAGVSGISCASTGAKTVNSGALTRYSGTAAVLNEVWLEVTTASTTTAAVVKLDSYTSADGTTAQSGGNVTWPASSTVVTTLIQVPLSATKQGVRSVEAGLNVVTANTASVVNVLIIRPLARLPIVAGQWNEISLLDDTMGLPQVFDNATLGLALYQTSNVTTTVWGTINCAYG